MDENREKKSPNSWGLKKHANSTLLATGFHTAFYPRGLLMVSLVGRSERGTTRSIFCPQQVRNTGGQVHTHSSLYPFQNVEKNGAEWS